MCCDSEAALWALWGRLVVAARVKRPRLCVGTSQLMLPEVDTPYTKERQGHRVCTGTTLSHYSTMILLLNTQEVWELRGKLEVIYKANKNGAEILPRLHMC